MEIWGVSVLAAATAAAAGTAVGDVWYSARGLGVFWSAAAGRISLFGSKRSNMALAIAFLFAFVAAAALSKLVGHHPAMTSALHTGLIVGLGCVAASFGMNYSLTQRGLKLAAIDGAFHVLQFLIYAAVLALFPW